MLREFVHAKCYPGFLTQVEISTSYKKQFVEHKNMNNLSYKY